MNEFNNAPSADVIIIEPTESALQILDKREADLIALREKNQGLVINGTDDKEGYKKVRAARLELKNARTSLVNDAKDLREGANKFIKTVISRQNQLIDIILPTEEALKLQEETYDEQIEKLRIEKERKENERIQSRIDALARFGHAIDLYDAKIMSDEEFNQLLTQAEIDYNEKQEAIATEKAAAESARIAEQERLRVEREELERQRAEQASREAELKRLEQEAIERARIVRDRIQREQDEQNKILAAERAEFEEKKRLHELEVAKSKAVEQARIDEQNRIKREQEEAKEKERLEKLEAERQEALKPDKERALGFASRIIAFVHTDESNPLFSDDQVIEIIAKAHSQMQSTAKWIEDEIAKL